MTINTTLFTEWRDRKDWKEPQFERDSPNLIAILDYLTGRWGGVSLGCHTDEPVRAGTRPRAHHFGSALDWRWERHANFPNARFLTRHQLDTEVLPVLINWSAELGIQAIHDKGRIWRSVRRPVDGGHGWKDQRTGYTGWVHIETTPQSFNDNVPIQTRLDIAFGGVGVQLQPAPPVVDFISGVWATWPMVAKPLIRLGSEGDTVRYLQSVIAHKGGGNIAIDGGFGPKTEQRVREVQMFWKHHGIPLVIDGMVGKNTWRVIDWMTTL
jgi:hypothetical protein